MTNLGSAQPAPQMRELDYLLGRFECHGEVLDTPFSKRHALGRILDGQMDLDGHWFFMRVHDLKTAEHPRPLRGNWQMTFVRGANRFVSLWTDNTGRWAEQHSPGWEGDSIAFTGAAIVDQRPAIVRDTLIKNGPDEMRFLVDFLLDGAWIRFLELTCSRQPA